MLAPQTDSLSLKKLLIILHFLIRNLAEKPAVCEKVCGETKEHLVLLKLTVLFAIFQSSYDKK